MGDLILAGVLTWLLVFVWWGFDKVLWPGKRGRHDRMFGGFLIAVAIVPSAIALWLGT